MSGESGRVANRLNLWHKRRELAIHHDVGDPSRSGFFFVNVGWEAPSFERTT